MTYMPQNIGAAPTPVGAAGSQQAIGGPMPFAAPNVGGMFSGDLAGSYQSAYNTALGQNQANYQNILSGYQKTLQGQQSAQQAIAGGYNQLYNNVLSGIQGIGQSQAQAIADAYAQQSGQSQQDLINRGLGNSTVLSSVQRGTQLDKQKADVALANQIAQLNAGYQSSLGMAGLNYANQANLQNSAQQNQQLQWMNSVQAQYPNAQAYAQLYQQQGATQQANANRAQAADQFRQLLGASRSAGAGGSTAAFANRPGGGGLGPGVMGAGGGGGGPLASVTPFGLGGVPGGAINPNFGGGPQGDISGALGGAASTYGFLGQGDISGALGGAASTYGGLGGVSAAANDATGAGAAAAYGSLPGAPSGLEGWF